MDPSERNGRPAGRIRRRCPGFRSAARRCQSNSRRDCCTRCPRERNSGRRRRKNRSTRCRLCTSRLARHSSGCWRRSGRRRRRARRRRSSQNRGRGTCRRRRNSRRRSTDLPCCTDCRRLGTLLWRRPPGIRLRQRCRRSVFRPRYARHDVWSSRRPTNGLTRRTVDRPCLLLPSAPPPHR